MQFEEVIVGQINDPEQFRSEHAWRSDVKYQLQFFAIFRLNARKHEPLLCQQQQKYTKDNKYNENNSNSSENKNNDSTTILCFASRIILHVIV